jgi:dTDP-4-dehydrorhamnose 3,5-epimerase
MAEPRVRPARLRDVLVVEPEAVRDERGFFVRTMDAGTLRAAGVDPAGFVQENQSRSRVGTLRGLHGRARLNEAKLVRCARGSVFEVVVDLRPWSATFEQWESFVLDDVAYRQVYVPAGCVHGFLALAEEVDVCYKHDAPYDRSVEIAVRWNDDDLAIDWPEPEPLVSPRDRDAPSLCDVRGHLTDWYGSAAPGRTDG